MNAFDEWLLEGMQLLELARHAQLQRDENAMLAASIALRLHAASIPAGYEVPAVSGENLH